MTGAKKVPIPHQPSTARITLMCNHAPWTIDLGPWTIKQQVSAGNSTARRATSTRPGRGVFNA